MSATGATIPTHVAEPLVDPAAYADGRVHESYRWLRTNNPLGRAEIDGFDPFWVVTKHADILAVSRQNDLFHNGDRPTVVTNQIGERRTREITGGSPHLVYSLVQMDPPDHPKHRALTQAWFMPANLKKLEERIRVIAKRAADDMCAKPGVCDFAAEVAAAYPLHVIMEIMGVPEEDEPRMLRLTQELFGPQDPETMRALDMLSPEQLTDLISATVDDFNAYFRRLSVERRARPREDLATVIANARIEGAPISDIGAMGYYIIVAAAGHDTTSSSTAGAIWALADNPGQFAKVKNDPSLIPSLVDEAVRWMTPVKHFMRSATAETELAGRQIAKGDWLMLCYASGNRDEEVFEDPYEFRVDRTPNRHLSFGYGAHLCLGQHLAKMEMRILFEELLPRLSSLELAGEPKLTQANFVNGPKSVPIRFALA